MVYNSTLKRKTPLKAKTGLKAKTPLKSYSTLKAKSTLKTRSVLQAKTPLKVKTTGKKPQAPYKPKYKYESIFTSDLSTCHITHTSKPYADVHVHHIFDGPNKANSEKYHFLVPLRADWHDMADYGIHFNRELDLKYKRMCQEYWLEHYGTREEFIKTFGQWW